MLKWSSGPLLRVLGRQEVFPLGCLGDLESRLGNGSHEACRMGAYTGY